MSNDLQDILVKAVSIAKSFVPGDAIAQKHLAVGFLLGQVEKVDDLLPGIGQFMDLPVVDQGQKYLLGAAVDWAFNYLALQE